MPIPIRNLMMVGVGLFTFVVIAVIVFYGPLMFGDPIPNFGIVLMMTVPVIAGVAFRVCLDAIIERR